MKLSSHARAALMNRLANSAGLQTGNPFGVPGASNAGMVMPGQLSGFQSSGSSKNVATPLSYDQGVLGPASPRPTQCLLIKNMFDPAEESEPNWNHDIEQDVREECSKYGKIEHVFADPKSKVSVLYISFIIVLFRALFI